MGPLPESVTLIGAGQVGQALVKALRARRISHQIFPFRRGVPTRARGTGLVLLCVRDNQLAQAIEQLTQRSWVRSAVVAHVSGVLGVEALADLEPYVRAVGQLHPFSSIRAIGHPSHFNGAYFLADGNRLALGRLRAFVRTLGGKLVRGTNVDRARYHLAAALLANGSIALLRASEQLLVDSGIDSRNAGKMLLELARSVLSNAQVTSFSMALTGPVRRGDIETIQRHLALLRGSNGTTELLYRGLLRAQLQIVNELRELDATTLRRIARRIGA